jgi:HSP20 family protein
MRRGQERSLDYIKPRIVMIIVRRSVRRSPVNVQREMERVFHSWVPQATSLPQAKQGVWRPALEVLETSEEFVITAELAGIDEQAIDVTVDGDVLTIAGNRSGRREVEACSYREAGINYGPFSAEIFIPGTLHIDEADARYVNGMLRIRIPKVQPGPSTPRRISLNNSGDATHHQNREN